ncbi:hypothetical protein BDZ91DRAFT_842326 [Kalaharituber pfeilii]|nr:hypothetical protein BDZ91DRAFT_842326 [Kalaharituber pfeilii]
MYLSRAILNVTKAARLPSLPETPFKRILAFTRYANIEQNVRQCSSCNSKNENLKTIVVEIPKDVVHRKYYVVFRGLNPGIYFEADEAREQTDGFSGGYHEKFRRLNDAVNCLRDHGYKVDVEEVEEEGGDED